MFGVRSSLMADKALWTRNNVCSNIFVATGDATIKTVVTFIWCNHRVSLLDNGQKCGECRSSAEEVGRMFSSATCDYSAKLRQTFGVTFAALHLQHFVLTTHKITLT